MNSNTFPRIRPHYVYIVMIDGEIKKACKTELQAYAFLGTLGYKAWDDETRKSIHKFNLSTGDEVHGRQRHSLTD